jgi:hypothetical protein
MFIVRWLFRTAVIALATRSLGRLLPALLRMAKAVIR